MKPSILKIFAGLTGCFLLISATAIKKTNPVNFKSHTAYWYVKSGDELIQVKKAVIPESALTKDNNGKLTGADENAIQNKVQFKNQKNYNGKKLDAQFIIISDGEDLDATGSMAKFFNFTLQCATMSAYYECWNGSRPPNGCSNFRSYCNYWSTGACMVIHSTTGGVFYITYYSATN